MVGLEISRLAEVVVTVGPSRYNLGTAYQISRNHLLTARHVARGRGGTSVDFEGSIRLLGEDSHFQPVALCWESNATDDLAVLKLSSEAGLNADVTPLSCGRLTRTGPLECKIAGFPRATRQNNRRDSFGMRGIIDQYGGIKENRLQIDVPDVYSDDDLENLSGAPVFVDDFVVAVVQGRIPGFSRLWAQPIEKLFAYEEILASLGLTTRDLVALTEVNRIASKFKTYLRRLVFEYENWSEFNDATLRNPKPNRSMMIEKMASTDLYHNFIPLGMEFMRLERPGWVEAEAAMTTDLQAQWLTPSGAQADIDLVLMLGDYGTGKSSCSINLTYRMAREYLEHPVGDSLIPVYVDLSRFRPFRNAEELLAALISGDYQVDVDARMLRTLANDGKLLLILDGFDEMASYGSIGDTLDNFREIARLSAPGTKVLLTARTHYFRTDAEVSRVVDNRSTVFDDDNPLLAELRQRSRFVGVKLREFSDEQVKELIGRRMGDSQITRVWEEISKRYNLPDLARRPVLLDMILSSMPILMKRGNTINAAQVYDAYTTLWINRDDWRSNLTPRGKGELMKYLARCMMAARLKTVDTRSDNGQKDATESPNMRVDELVQAMAEVPAEWLKSPGQLARRNVDLIDYDLRTCSFLRRDTDGCYFFSHRSILEYFLARSLLDTIGMPDSPLCSSPVSTYFTGIEVRWQWLSPETIAFLVAIIQTSSEKRAAVLDLTRSQCDFGGNGLTLAWEAVLGARPRSTITGGSAPDHSLSAWEASRHHLEQNVGPNLRHSMAYGLDLSGRDLTGADFSYARLASLKLERARIRDTKWSNTHSGSIMFMTSRLDPIPQHC